VNSSCTPRFWECYQELPEAVRELARKNYELWRDDPRHPSLNFKPVGRGVWSVRIGRSYRALGHVEDGEISWVWIGHHSVYDHLL
jgi:hypothetical protein